MKKLFIICLLALSLVATSCGPTAKTLVVLHTNDTHSQIEPVRVGRSKGLGGVDRRLQYINSIREQYGDKNVLLVDAGDYNQGTPYFTVANGDLEMELMNALKYDVAALGNHEFDNGQEELKRRLVDAHFPTLCCNYDFSQTVLKDIVKEYTIIKRAGRKIGIIGVTCHLETVVMRSFLEGMTRVNTIERVNSLADMLKNEKKCDIVILLSHLGYQGGSLEYPSDILMAENSRNIDFIIGGHSHTFLSEAKEVKDLDGKRVVITQSGGQGVVVGTLIIPTQTQSSVVE